MSTREDYIKDLATRSFTATPDMEPNKYRDAIRLTSEMKAHPWKFRQDKELMLLRSYIGWFKNHVEDFGVAIPYAEELGEFWPAAIPRSMRDYEHFTALIEISALFHCYQRPVLESGEDRIVLATMKDLQYVLDNFSYLEETTITGLAKHVLDCFHKAMEPLFADKIPFRYEDLTRKYNEVFTERKSTRTLRRYVELLEEIGWVDTEPDPNDKRKNLVRIIRKPENTVFSSLNKFPSSFTQENLENWFNKIWTRGQVLLRDNILHVENNILLPTLYKKHYCVTISSKQKKQPKHETNRGKVVFHGNTVIPSVQEALEYSLGMMAKRLPNKTTGDDFVHDLQFKGLDKEEAEKLLDKLTDEGPLGYNSEGWLIKR